MTPEQIKLVKESWEKVVPISEQAAELFYGRLFEQYPEVKSMFTGDMTEQGRKLMATLNIVVNALDNLEPMVSMIAESGRRHAGYGVKDEDYDKVAAALLWTLEQGLQEAFTADVKTAWVEAYTTLAGVMKSAAAGQSVA
jgi:hemoglobin-like flavoprotein